MLTKQVKDESKKALCTKQTAANKVDNKGKKRTSYEKETQNTKETLMTKVKISKLQVLTANYAAKINSLRALSQKRSNQSIK